MTLTAEERNETRILTADGRYNTLTIPPREEAEADASVRRASGLIGEVAACGAAIVPYSLSVRPINQRPPLVTSQGTGNDFFGIFGNINTVSNNIQPHVQISNCGFT